MYNCVHTLIFYYKKLGSNQDSRCPGFTQALPESVPLSVYLALSRNILWSFREVLAAMNFCWLSLLASGNNTMQQSKMNYIYLEVLWWILSHFDNFEKRKCVKSWKLDFLRNFKRTHDFFNDEKIKLRGK